MSRMMIILLILRIMRIMINLNVFEFNIVPDISNVEHVEDDRAALASIAKKLKPGGKIRIGGQKIPQEDGKDVIILGGGDTGADCLGTALRQGAESVTTLAIGKRPADTRPADQPWPMDPTVFEVRSAHEEGGVRTYLASTVEFIGDDKGNLTGLVVAETEYFDGGRRPKAGTEKTIPADLVFLALGFTGAEGDEITDQLGVDIAARGNVARSKDFETNVPGVFVAGDAGRGASLIVWAIAEGRSAAARADAFLGGRTVLPAPVTAHDAPIHF